MDCDKKYLEKCKKKLDTPVKKPKKLKETEILKPSSLLGVTICCKFEGNNINLFLLAGNTPNGTKRFKATGNPASLIIHVGNATGRVALAQSLFTVANGSFDAGTTIAI